MMTKGMIFGHPIMWFSYVELHITGVMLSVYLCGVTMKSPVLSIGYFQVTPHFF